MTAPDAISRQALAAHVRALAGSQVWIVGDVMLDRYYFGSVERISPEAPVPVVRVAEERLHLGGAGNVANNIAQLGGAPRLLSITGDDAERLALDSLLGGGGIDAMLLVDPGRPTIVKTRVVAHHQQVVRFDRESSAPVPDKTVDAVLQTLAAEAGDGAVVVLSDYGKGLITPFFMTRLRDLMRQRRYRVLVDPKVSNFALYGGVHLLTPNTQEAQQGSGVASMGERIDILRAGMAIFKKLKCDHLLITLGARGMALFDAPGRVLHLPTQAKEVFDVTGAGDTVIATVALALAAGVDLPTACQLANLAAGIVVGEIGTACVRPEQLSSTIENSSETQYDAWLWEDV